MQHELAAARALMIVVQEGLMTDHRTMDPLLQQTALPGMVNNRTERAPDPERLEVDGGLLRLTMSFTQSLVCPVSTYGLRLTTFRPVTTFPCELHGLTEMTAVGSR